MMFGNLIEIRGDKIDNVIESAPPQTFIIIHIYDEVCVCVCPHGHFVSNKSNKYSLIDL